MLNLMGKNDEISHPVSRRVQANVSAVLRTAPPHSPNFLSTTHGALETGFEPSPLVSLACPVTGVHTGLALSKVIGNVVPCLPMTRSSRESNPSLVEKMYSALLVFSRSSRENLPLAPLDSKTTGRKAYTEFLSFRRALPAFAANQMLLKHEEGANAL